MLVIWPHHNEPACRAAMRPFEAQSAFRAECKLIVSNLYFPLIPSLATDGGDLRIIASCAKGAAAILPFRFSEWRPPGPMPGARMLSGLKSE